MRGERDEAARDRVAEELRAGASVGAAARAAGVHRQAVYRWVERGDQELGDLLRATRAGRQAASGGPRLPAPGLPAPAQALPAPGSAQELTDAEVARLRLVGLRVLEEIANDPRAACGPRAAAAKALQEVGERWAARTQPTAQAPEAVAASEPPAPSNPAEVVAKFRVVS